MTLLDTTFNGNFVDNCNLCGEPRVSIWGALVCLHCDRRCISGEKHACSICKKFLAAPKEDEDAE